MERTLLILNSLTNSTKLEYHHHFLEFYKGVNVFLEAFEEKVCLRKSKEDRRSAVPRK